MPDIYYLGAIQFPYTPDGYSISVDGRIEKYDLLNGTEIAYAKSPGLSDFTLSCFFDRKDADSYLGTLETYITGRSPVNFIVNRLDPSGNLLWDTSIRVLVSKYTINEEASDGPVVSIDLELKKYVYAATKTIRYNSNGTVSISKPREDTRTQAKTYTVVQPTNLISIAATQLVNIPGNQVNQRIKELNPKLYSQYGIRELPIGTVVKLA